tara:strand:- start:282 stop:512 length:231 start_codon:yes stop_codon:yes gene_type:complete
LCSCNKTSTELYYDLGYIGGFNDGRDQAFLMQSYYKCVKVRSAHDCRILKRKIDNFEKRFEMIERRLYKNTRGTDG